MNANYTINHIIENEAAVTDISLKFPRTESQEGPGFDVQAMIFTKKGNVGKMSYLYLRPNKNQAAQVITDLSISGPENWANALVLTEALQGILKDSIIIEKTTEWDILENK